MFKEKSKGDIDYDKDFKIVIGTDSVKDDQAKVHQLKSLESFSRSSESLALSVTSIGEHPKLEKEKRKKKTRSASRGKNDENEKPCDYGVSRDSGESFMSAIMANVKREGWGAMEKNEEERLKLMNIGLEEKLSVIHQASEDSLREQVKLRCELEVAKKEMAAAACRLEKIEREEKQWSRERESLNEHGYQLEKRVQLLQTDVAVKVAECEQMNEQLFMMQDTVRRHEQSAAIVRDDVAMKESVIGDLKKKMSELYSQLELVKLYRENSEYQAEQVRLELDVAHNTRSWLEEQLTRMESVREQLQSEVERVRRSFDESETERDALATRNELLVMRLARMKQARLSETTELLFELERLQSEIMASGDERDSLEDKYNTLMVVFEAKSDECESARVRSRDLESEYNAVCLELEESGERCRRAQNELMAMETESSELRTRLAVTESDLVMKLAELQALADERVSLDESVRELRSLSADKDCHISELNEQLTNVRRSLERVTSERDQSTVYIAQLRDDCEKVAAQFELTRETLCEREESLRLMDEFGESMKGELLVSVSVADGLRTERDQMAQNCLLLQASHSQVRDELDNLRRSLADAHLKMASMEEEMASVVASNVRASEESQMTAIELERVRADLIVAQQRAECLCAVENEVADLLARVTDLQTKLRERDSELARVVSLKDEMEQTGVVLRDELETVKFAHVVELANREKQYHERLDESEREFSQMCQEKIRCESAIDSLQTHINVLVDDYNNRLGQYQAKMASLEEKSSAYDEYEKKSSLLMEELARRKGELEGVLAEWKKMREHAAVLETALARREASAVDLVNKQAVIVSEKESMIRDMASELRRERDMRANDAMMSGTRQTQLETQVAALSTLGSRLSEYEMRCSALALELDSSKHSEEILMDELGTLKETYGHVIAELERKNDENKQLMTANQRLLDQVDILKAKEEAGNKSIRAIQHDVQQSSARIESGHKKREKLVQRYNREKNEMKYFVKDVQQEKESLTRSVELSQQREIIASSILSQLRSEVKRILFDDEMTRPISDAEVTLSCDRFQQLQTLLTETEVPMKASRPLSRLSKCIEDLRTHIDAMQGDVNTQLNEESGTE